MDPEMNICIKDKCLSRVSQIKFLGTIIDDKVSWKPHIDYRSKKLSKAIAFMYKLKVSLPSLSIFNLLECDLGKYIKIPFKICHFPAKESCPLLDIS